MIFFKSEPPLFHPLCLSVELPSLLFLFCKNENISCVRVLLCVDYYEENITIYTCAFFLTFASKQGILFGQINI